MNASKFLRNRPYMEHLVKLILEKMTQPLQPGKGPDDDPPEEAPTSSGGKKPVTPRPVKHSM